MVKDNLSLNMKGLKDIPQASQWTAKPEQMYMVESNSMVVSSQPQLGPLLLHCFECGGHHGMSTDVSVGEQRKTILSNVSIRDNIGELTCIHHLCVRINAADVVCSDAKCKVLKPLWTETRRYKLISSLRHQEDDDQVCIVRGSNDIKPRGRVDSWKDDDEAS